VFEYRGVAFAGMIFGDAIQFGTLHWPNEALDPYCKRVVF
jgi:hypothetical protein